MGNAISSSFNDDLVELFSGNYSSFKYFISYYERNQSEVDDIIQNALLQALLSQNSFRYQSSLKTWVFGILKNVARRHISKEVSGTNVIIHISDSDIYTQLMESQCADEAFDPEKIVEINQELMKYQKELDYMSEGLRKTFELYFIEEETYDAIGEKLGIPTGTVKSRVSRIRKQLSRSVN